MNTLLENPLPALVVGVLALAVLGLALFATGRRSIAWAMGGVVLVTAALVALEHFVVTDVEQINAIIHAAAAAIEAGDTQAVLDHISPTAKKMRSEASAAIKKYRFESVRVNRDLKILVETDPDPPRARATFHIIAKAAGGAYPLLLTVDLRREEGRWRFYRYEYKLHHPLAGLRK